MNLDKVVCETAYRECKEDILKKKVCVCVGGGGGGGGEGEGGGRGKVRGGEGTKTKTYTGHQYRVPSLLTLTQGFV